MTEFIGLVIYVPNRSLTKLLVFAFCFLNRMLQKTVKNSVNYNFSITEHCCVFWVDQETIWNPLV